MIVDERRKVGRGEEGKRVGKEGKGEGRSKGERRGGGGEARNYMNTDIVRHSLYCTALYCTIHSLYCSFMVLHCTYCTVRTVLYVLCAVVIPVVKHTHFQYNVYFIPPTTVRL